jgi:hypothetical protein
MERVSKSKDDIVLQDLNGFLVDPEILKILSFHFVDGNPATALINPGLLFLQKHLQKNFFPEKMRWEK